MFHKIGSNGYCIAITYKNKMAIVAYIAGSVNFTLGFLLLSVLDLRLFAMQGLQVTLFLFSSGMSWP